jgi:NAD(P)H-flavin reductase
MKSFIAEAEEYRRLTRDTINIEFYVPEGVLEMCRPGQFLNLYPRRPDMLLPRPLSICTVD